MYIKVGELLSKNMVFAFFPHCLGNASAQCVTWTEQPFQNTTSALNPNDPDATPFGFANDVLPGVESVTASNPYPCITVNFVQANIVKVLVLVS